MAAVIYRSFGYVPFGRSSGKKVRPWRPQSGDERSPVAAGRNALARFEESYLLPAEEASENDVRAEVRVSLGLGAGGCRRPAAE